MYPSPRAYGTLVPAPAKVSQVPQVSFTTKCTVPAVNAGRVTAKLTPGTGGVTATGPAGGAVRVTPPNSTVVFALIDVKRTDSTSPGLAGSAPAKTVTCKRPLPSDC